MKSLRFVRKLGKRGMFSLPIKIREALNITTEDEFEVFVDDDKLVLIKKTDSIIDKIKNDIDEDDFKIGLEPIINSLIELLIFEDDYMKDRIIRVRKYTEMLANVLSEKDKYSDYISYAYIKLLKKAVLFYDIGRIGLPEDILNKEGKLNPKEFNYVQEHTLRGSEILSKLIRIYPGNEFLELAQSLAYYHHEKWDGSGYPNGLKGDEIPLASRIIAVTGVYHSLISERPYRTAYSEKEALKILKDESGKHFDPFIVDIFLKNKDRFIEG